MKRTLLMLHGALGSWGTLHPLLEEIRDDYRIHVMDFDGHGYGPAIDKPFSIKLFAENTLEYLENRGLNNVDIFGYSMGGYVGLYLSSFYPARIGSVYTLGTKFDWTPEAAAKEAKMLNPDVMEEKIPAFVEDIKARILDKDWRVLVNKTAEMMTEMGNKPPVGEKKLKKIKNEVRIALGSKDRMVTEAESRWAADLLENGEFKLLDGIYHPIPKWDAKAIAADMHEFFYD